MEQDHRSFNTRAREKIRWLIATNYESLLIKKKLSKQCRVPGSQEVYDLTKAEPSDLEHRLELLEQRLKLVQDWLRANNIVCMLQQPMRNADFGRTEVLWVYAPWDAVKMENFTPFKSIYYSGAPLRINESFFVR